MEKKALIAVLVLSLIGNAALAYFLGTRNAIDYEAKYSEMKTSYISVATAQKYLLETMQKSPEDFQALMPEYKNVSKDKFQEAVRRTIVELELDIDELQKQ